MSQLTDALHPRPKESLGPEQRVGPTGPADHRPPEEAERAPSEKVAAQSRPGRFPLGGGSSLVSSYTGRCCSHACPTWSLVTPAPQRAFQTFTATPTNQFTTYPFSYVSGLVTHPSPSALYTGLGAHVLDIAKGLPSALHRRNAFGTVVIHVGANDISDRCSELCWTVLQPLSSRKCIIDAWIHLQAYSVLAAMAEAGRG
ncbi:hypothetical protein AOLI_G00303710 [Acnodon oligacanthus]